MLGEGRRRGDPHFPAALSFNSVVSERGNQMHSWLNCFFGLTQNRQEDRQWMPQKQYIPVSGGNVSFISVLDTHTRLAFVPTGYVVNLIRKYKTIRRFRQPTRPIVGSKFRKDFDIPASLPC